MPSGSRLLVASAAATRLAAAADWLDGHSPDVEILVVAPSWEAADGLVRAAAARALARFGTTRLTLDRLAARLAAPILARTCRTPARGLSPAAVAARALHLPPAQGAR